MKPKLNINPNLCMATLLAAGLIAPTQSALAKTKKTGSSLQKANELIEAENAQMRRQLADSRLKQQELQKTIQAKSAAKTLTVAGNNPFGATELPARDKQIVPAEMACGANMKMGASGSDAGQMKMEPGDQFLFNPVFGGGEMFNAHPKGMWMLNAKWMHMQMDGLQAGTKPVQESQVGPPVGPSSPVQNVKYPYMMIPTHMTMDMMMFMGMYGVTDKLTLMGMLNYQTSGMQMLMDMGNQFGNDFNMISGSPPMNTGGLGDTEIDALYKIYDSKLGKVTGTLGLSLPTGSTKQGIDAMGTTFRAPYDMQLGSGTVDFKPALTYNWVSDNVLWNLGGQASGIVHTGTNHGWAYGNSIKLSTWGQRAFGPATTWVRLRYTDTAQIQGSDPQIQLLMDPENGAPTPDADPHNYGGKILNAFVGASYKYKIFSFGVEGGVPAYQYLNGLQMKNSWQITSGFQAMF